MYKTWGPPLTLPSSSVGLRIFTTSMEMVPSDSRMRLPGLRVWHSLSYERPMRVSVSF